MNWTIILYALISVIIVSIISLIGIVTFLFNNNITKIIMLLVSLSVGALLGDVFIHLLPEAFVTGPGVIIGIYVIIGILFSFIIEKFIHWRHCHIPESTHHHHPFTYVNLVGDTFHNFIDGFVVAGAYFISIPVGIATTIAIVLHEIPHEFGNFGVLVHGGFSKGKALLFNFLTALAAILGAIIGIVIGANQGLLIFLIPFAAGNLLYIAGSDLIPELHKHTEDKKQVRHSFAQLGMILLGIGLMMLILLVE